ncbi:putative MFS transporter superfamily [Helianthus annuus]|nr:putative MFS transporter superfamily [Helianthus annuus]KAJ0552971.1 putative MFS transporter superfamily [Helianthus annuus]KAJ0718652.1 putative MFS transporter superfamily [Helianthus annuus]KAJ0721893.1 putative MFS transporter superfamily [Helianthus annuus]
MFITFSSTFVQKNDDPPRTKSRNSHGSYNSWWFLIEWNPLSLSLSIYIYIYISNKANHWGTHVTLWLMPNKLTPKHTCGVAKNQGLGSFFCIKREKLVNQMNINGGFRAKMEHYMYSGEKKHVMAGMAIIGVIFGIPWYLMNRVLIWADLLAAFAMYVMMTYLTNVWNLITTHAAGMINIWNGITPALAIGFAFIVNAFMGDFYMLIISSISYSVERGAENMCERHRFKINFFDFPTIDSNTMETIRRALHAVSWYSND